MCSDSNSNPIPCDFRMKPKYQNHSHLLELAAADDLPAFVHETDRTGSDIDRAGLWYGRSFGPLTKMAFEERTPIMIASLYGSTAVLTHILAAAKVDVNRACGSDGATALHCAAAGGAPASIDIIKLLISSSADTNAVDANGRKPGDLIPHNSNRKPLELLLNGTTISDEGSKKKDYPIDIPLPDINNSLYGSDEFRMYTFKIKPCSRAYSHDWTECPFVHPGENARRRDPRKYYYTCVPCPDFKKGNCTRSDSCEYAHGVFESWLHPAQYRTRLCKDETGCSRKVCFFAHSPEDLRPLYPSTGSGMPSPSSATLDISSPSFKMPNTSTPPMSPCSSPMGGGMWQNNLTPPPALQLSGSRLKTSFSARNIDLDMEFLQRQQLVDEMVNSVSSPYGRIGDLNPSNLNDVYGSPTQHSMNNQSYAYSNARMSAFAKRSQSFNYGLTASSPSFSPAKLTQWGSPDGKLEWGFRGEDESKLRKSASFGNRNVQGGVVSGEPDVSWVNSLVRDGWLDQVCIEQEQIVA